MPCYLEDNVDRQRGKGVFDGSIRGLQRLNALGYGRDGSGLALNLVYNPQGPSLPPPQAALEADYKRVLGEQPRHRVQPALHARQHADPALRLDADLQGRVRQLSRHAAARASRRQSRRRDVPQPDLGRLARLRLRLRLQPDARSADGARRTRARSSVGAARRRHRRQSDPRRRPLLRLHRRPGLELRRRAEGGRRSEPRASTARPPPAASARPTTAIRPPCSTARRRSRATCFTWSAASTAISPRSRPSSGWPRPSARRRRSCSTAISTGSTPSRHGLRRDRARRARHTRRCAATSRPRSRGCTTSAPAAAAPIRRASDDDIVRRSNEILRELAHRRARDARAPGSRACRCTSWRKSARFASASSTAMPPRSPAGASPTMRSTIRPRPRLARRRPARLAHRSVRLDPHLPCGAARLRAAGRPADRSSTTAPPACRISPPRPSA